MTAHQGYKSFEEFRAWATERMLAIKDKIMLSDLQYFEMRKEFFAMLALQGFVQSFFYIPSLYKLKKLRGEWNAAIEVGATTHTNNLPCVISSMRVPGLCGRR
eukprot:m.206104 g.206104  ORF g.206104 m.206104 type:complete len:103 (+) comp10119_c0_seq60:906-1214(+)